MTIPTNLTLVDELTKDEQFILAMAQYADGTLSEKIIRDRYKLDGDQWEKLAENDQLVQRIQDEKIRRIRSGATARERAQQLHAEAPGVLGKILHGDDISPRHKIEAAREIRAVAATGPEDRSATDRFVIHIDLTADAKLKGIEPDPRDVINLEVELPQKTPAAITDQSEDDWRK
jgi:hypothetical protein